MPDDHRLKREHGESESKVASSYSHSDKGSALEETGTTHQDGDHGEVERGIPGGAHRDKKPFRFLALPAEIRQIIYHFVFGDQTIRVRYYDDYGHDDEDEFAEDFFVTEILSFRFHKMDIATDLEGLFWCEWNLGNEGAADNGFYGGDPVCLNLLLANRQVYSEACKIPYSTNTFSFFQAHAFQLFVSPLFSGCPRDSCRKLVRSVALYLPLFVEPTAEDWDAPPSFSPAWEPHGLDGLQQLHIVVGRREGEGGGMDTDLERSDEEWTEIYHLNDLFVFAKLNLQKVTVEVLLNWNCDESEQEQAKAFERRLEGKLLGCGKDDSENVVQTSDSKDSL
ncbi:hypothetical protein BJX68DRAFT_269306 [Aspergillus pseudodeflectus]|uniref:DUF7730 domain-containing protein n=1 Tax=Aspergillus pseudodeflectus TaxID=176178 RepID=A0ABR4JYL0_9EURO